MKPLSIEEIKQLKCGDWVWVVGIERKFNEYGQIKCNSQEKWVGGTFEYLYFNYGKTWLAYRNKEQAECKGELVEFPRIIHPNELEWFVQYQYPSGIIDYEIFYSLEKAEQKLKELRNIDG